MSEKKMFVCEECGKGYLTKRGLERHKGWKARNAWRDEVSLTEEQRQLILGSVMGDMCIRYPHPNSVNPMLSVVHSVAQADYLQWKYLNLINLVKTPPQCMENRGFGAGKKIIRFCTLGFPCLIPIYNLVFRRGVRTITEDLLSEINTPTALSTWYLDDGSLVKRKNRRGDGCVGHRVSISLGKSLREESDLIVRWLGRTWGVNANAYCYKKETSVSIGQTSDVDAFLEIVRPTALKAGMDYKVTRDYTYTTSQ